ncbi:MAG: zinc ribbon domain-containing protein [Chloroflexi bacterium]|nr:zinc ribbon domain-containing protein [Chloroflexota bacterium]
MPIYEYQSKSGSNCPLCKVKFEMRQAISDEPITECPRCSRKVERIISKSFIVSMDPLSPEETFATHTEKEADSKGLEGGFAPDEIYD